MTLVLEGNRKNLKLAKLKGHVVNGGEKGLILNGKQNLDTVSPKPELGVDQLSAQVYSDLDKMVNAEKMLSCRCQSSQTTEPTRFTQRAYLTILTLSRILEKDPGMAELSSVLLAHTVLLDQLELSHRRITLDRLQEMPDLHLSKFVDDFARIASIILKDDQWARSMELGNIKCDIADLFDGRLLQLLVYVDNRRLMAHGMSPSFDSLAHAICTLSGTHLAPFNANGDTYEKVAKSDGSAAADKPAILPFANAVFDKHLASIGIANAKPTVDHQMGRIHKEITHWHNAKRPLIVKAAVPVNPREAKRVMKRNDFFMAEMQAYAASLTNATGKSLEPDIVTVSDKPSTKATYSKDSNVNAESTSKSNASRPTKNKAIGKKSTGKQAMLDDIAANKAVKDNDSIEKIFSSWRFVRVDLSSEKSFSSQYTKLTAYLNNLPEVKKAILKPEVQWNLLNVLLAMYTTLSKEKTSHRDSEKYGIAAILFDTARKLANTEGLTKTIATQLQTVVNALRLPFINIVIPSVDRKLAYDPGMRLTGKGELDLGLEPHEFQLAYSGPYMDRNLDSAPDSRVPFEPDGWQRKVLDELDQDHSVFVVAPTSAGKTFISFYAMERILRANDDGVLGKH